MTDTYNMTGFETANNLYDIFLALNTTTGHLIAGMMLISLFIVIVVGLLYKNNPVPESITAAGVVFLISTVLFTYMELLSARWILLGTVIVIVGMIALYRSNSV